MTESHIALLRGINVGGRNKLPMRDLAAIFVEAGCADVATYIQSGNVVFTAQAELVLLLPSLVEGMIAARVDLRVPVVTRSSAELDEIVSRNPFLDLETDFTKLHVAFRQTEPNLVLGATV